MLKLPCPACGAELAFASRTSVFAVCAYCRSTVVRRDVNLETLGKMAELAPDLSPLQLGVRGKFEGKGFELRGRLKISWKDGGWNEWYAVFDDGREGWLAEAQGQYMMSFAVPTPPGLPERAKLEPGIVVKFGPKPQDEFEVDDIKEATCAGSEGELPFRGAQGRRSVSVDLSGEGGLFAGLDFSEEGARAFVGRYVELEALSPTGLRQLDGW